ncbi:hypothetical protein Gasu2_62770 [Galdieria sulphuraria]|nr:hypothetical protein Gasu2_62770 [Galdieria sulphuraria]
MMALNKDKEKEGEEQGLRYQVRKRISPLPISQTYIPEYYYSRVSPVHQVKASRGELLSESWSVWEARNGLWSPELEQNCSPSLFLHTPTSSTGKHLTESLREWAQTEQWSNDDTVVVQTTSENTVLAKQEKVTYAKELPQKTLLTELANSVCYPPQENSRRSNIDDSNNVVWLSKTNTQMDALQNGIPAEDEQKCKGSYVQEQAEPFYSDSLSIRVEDRHPFNTPTEEQYSIQFVNQLNKIGTQPNEIFSNNDETQCRWKSPQSSNEMHCSSKKRSVKDDIEMRAARIMRNREAAQRSRQNAKAKLQYLEKENKRLRSNLYILERENFWLRKQVELVQNCVSQLKENTMNKYSDMSMEFWQGDSDILNIKLFQIEQWDSNGCVNVHGCSHVLCGANRISAYYSFRL